MNTSMDCIKGDHHEDDRGAYLPDQLEIAAACLVLRARKLKMLRASNPKSNTSPPSKIKRNNQRGGTGVWGV